MSWASLAVAIVSLGIAGLTALFGHRAIRSEARDRREQLDLLRQEIEGDRDLERRNFLGTGTTVYEELLRAAEWADHYKQSQDIHTVMKMLPRDGWSTHRTYLAGELGGNAIWKELREAQDALDQTKAQGAPPPDGEYLRGLAVRFEHEVRTHASAKSV
jgi:hypothetical protein